MATSGYQICTFCVMDTSANGITFDLEGRCNFCRDFSRKLKNFSIENRGQEDAKLEHLIDQVKRNGKGKEYDCIVGISGGIDSSWALLKVVELGLRPLAVHMDNGWDSELAQNNISNLITKLGVDLYTYVIEWEEYRSLMNSFFQANVIDVELLYDNAMLAVNYEQAQKYGLKFILSGTNTATEGMRIPSNWNWYKLDSRNIKSIAKNMGNIKLKSFPHFSTGQYILNRFIYKINWVPFLDYLGYNKELAIKELVERIDFRPYPYKHYESIFTRFYQGHILPNKFNVDKRRVHLSTLIVSGQMSRNEAERDLLQIPYPNESSLNNDIQYFIKKMNWGSDELTRYLDSDPKPHEDYSSEIWFVNLVRKMRRLLNSNLK